MLDDALSENRWSEEEAFAWCERLARSHYENFPVGSLLVPSHLRRHFHSIYAYSRLADDIADEGDLPLERRLDLLERWEMRLDESARGEGRGPLFTALGATIRERSLPLAPLRDLLTAFRHDARGGGFEDRSALESYCAHSANPVGRLILHLHGLGSDERLQLSDAVCTGLQLVNFWQDLSVDLPRGRINVPLDLLAEHHLTPDELTTAEAARLAPLIGELIEWSEERLGAGSSLPETIPQRRLRWELRSVLCGGNAMVKLLRESGTELLRQRPSLSPWKRGLILLAPIFRTSC